MEAAFYSILGAFLLYSHQASSLPRTSLPWWLSLTESSSKLPPSPVCCECVSHYNCINNTITTDGVGLINVRLGLSPTSEPEKPAVNVNICPHSTIDICCTVPDAPPQCKDMIFEDEEIKSVPGNSNSSNSISYTPHPNSNCECVMHYDCDPDLVVSNNGGKTSLLLINHREVSHSKCLHSMEVCCFTFDPPDYGLPDQPNNATEKNIVDESCECVQPIMCDSKGYIIIDGSFMMDVRIGSVRPRICPYDKSLVCCKLPKEESVETTYIESTSTTTAVENVMGDEICECVQPRMCDSKGYIITDGSFMMDLRIGFATPEVCPYDKSLVCCKPPPRDSTATTHSESSTTATTDDVINRIMDETTPASTVQPRPSDSPKCGARNSNGYGARILGFADGQSQFGEFPWVAALLGRTIIENITYPLFVGGASLIHKRIAITAAHKVKKNKVALKDLTVRLGEWDTSSIREIHLHYDTQVSEIITHPKFNPITLRYDVAILLLKDSVPFGFNIRPICIARSVQEVDPSKCVINGWGKNAFEDGEHQHILKSIDVPLVSHNLCQSQLRKSRLGKYFHLHHTFRCAGGEEGKDACEGDGGGPLACRKVNSQDDEYLQVGMSAWGIGCGEKDRPGVYADVIGVSSWIHQKIDLLLKRNTSVPSAQLKKTTKRFGKSNSGKGGENLDGKNGNDDKDALEAGEGSDANDELKDREKEKKKVDKLKSWKEIQQRRKNKRLDRAERRKRRREERLKKNRG